MDLGCYRGLQEEEGEDERELSSVGCGGDCKRRGARGEEEGEGVRAIRWSQSRREEGEGDELRRGKKDCGDLVVAGRRGDAGGDGVEEATTVWRPCRCRRRQEEGEYKRGEEKRERVSDDNKLGFVEGERRR